MADDIAITTGIARHGASRLPSVDVDSFNLELKDEDGFLGDRASKGAFRKILDAQRKPLKKNGMRAGCLTVVLQRTPLRRSQRIPSSSHRLT